MEIKEVKDLELIKNALENYIPKAEEAVKVLIDSKLPESMIETTKDNIRRGKEMIDELDNELMKVVIEKAKNLIDNGGVTEVVFEPKHPSTEVESHKLQRMDLNNGEKKRSHLLTIERGI